ncbi:hypothetical protein SERLADRAFT_415073 [Serpula lacrymans var. lacrymans S7.9]|uniref:Uncharacterized protein n=2 Tax=Serpula lacrymans var. lacrymans TaxID=341189 RepID=F8NT59_SERL9|nr:uncharacterized protein SERLADRAFT_415073 [Serpula lacrymans var. lacrymans S7.9]EGO25532.1 hypothetical protein SERLADRAFT_415073 [Serpula lacrymans var. lacrymans S7.9]
MFDPADIPLPRILDPILDFLSEKLSPPAYDFLLSFISHALALVSALVSLVLSLVASKPWEWDAQTIIPPLITVLAAYLALISLYRTTTWMFRTALWFIKWGSIIGALAAGTGWYLGNQGGGGGGVASTLGSIVLGILNNQGRNDAAYSQPRYKSSTSRSSRTRSDGQKRPKPWESFEKHEEWQYKANDEDHSGGEEAGKIMSDIVDSVNHIMGEGGWWDTAKAAFGTGSATEENADTTRSGRRKKDSRSR